MITQDKTHTLSIASEVTIQHFEECPLDFLLEASAVSYPFKYDANEQLDLVPYQTLCFSLCQRISLQSRNFRDRRLDSRLGRSLSARSRVGS
jgi:hypothetical protein